MFRMSADVKIGSFKPFKPSSLKWEVSTSNYFDNAKIVIPAMCRLKDDAACYSVIQTGNAFKEGDKVEIFAGYDGKNDLQFKGFISRINFKIPLEIECEGYAYQLKRKIINKTFGKTTVKELLNFLIQGTDIKLSVKNPAKIHFNRVAFKNITALQVLDYLKEKYLLTVFFNYDQLYVGWLATYEGEKKKFRLNWNVVSEDNMLFQTYTGSIVQTELEFRQKAGLRKKVKAQNVKVVSGIKKIRTAIEDDEDMQLAANDSQLKRSKSGYFGSLTAFLKPFVRPGMTAEIIDKKHVERNGSYFIDSVKGSFDIGGGRQVVGIAFGTSVKH